MELPPPNESYIWDQRGRILPAPTNIGGSSTPLDPSFRQVGGSARSDPDAKEPPG